MIGYKIRNSELQAFTLFSCFWDYKIATTHNILTSGFEIFDKRWLFCFYALLSFNNLKFNILLRRWLHNNNGHRQYWISYCSCRIRKTPDWWLKYIRLMELRIWLGSKTSHRWPAHFLGHLAMGQEKSRSQKIVKVSNTREWWVITSLYPNSTVSTILAWNYQKLNSHSIKYIWKTIYNHVWHHTIQNLPNCRLCYYVYQSHVLLKLISRLSYQIRIWIKWNMIGKQVCLWNFGTMNQNKHVWKNPFHIEHWKELT